MKTGFLTNARGRFCYRCPQGQPKYPPSAATKHPMHRRLMNEVLQRERGSVRFAPRLRKIMKQAFDRADALVPEAECASAAADAETLLRANAKSQTTPGSLIDILCRLERADGPRD